MSHMIIWCVMNGQGPEKDKVNLSQMLACYSPARASGYLASFLSSKKGLTWNKFLEQ